MRRYFYFILITSLFHFISPSNNRPPLVPSYLCVTNSQTRNSVADYMRGLHDKMQQYGQSRQPNQSLNMILNHPDPTHTGPFIQGLESLLRNYAISERTIVVHCGPDFFSILREDTEVQKAMTRKSPPQLHENSRIWIYHEEPFSLNHLTNNKIGFCRILLFTMLHWNLQRVPSIPNATNVTTWWEGDPDNRTIVFDSSCRLLRYCLEKGYLQRTIIPMRFEFVDGNIGQLNLQGNGSRWKYFEQKS